MEKWLKALALIGVGLICFALFRSFNNSRTARAPDIHAFSEEIVAGGLFRLQKLPPGILVQGESFEIKTEILNKDPAILSLQASRQELLIIQLLRNLEKENRQASQIIIYQKAPERPVAAILNQFGVSRYWVDKVQFQPTKAPDVIATVDGADRGLESIGEDFYYWGAVDTQIFNRQIELAKQAVLKKKPKKDFHQPLPLNIVKPRFSVEIKPDWTPRLGPLETKKQWIVFTDFYSSWSRNFYNKVSQWSKQFPEVSFGFRPLIDLKDPYQVMLAQMSFCVWNQHPENFFPFMAEAIKHKGLEFEAHLYETIERQGLALDPLKQCLYQKTHDKVVEYHQGYASYLGIVAGPVVFANDLVYAGGLSEEDILEQLTDWKLQ
jgi:protein-disulfide isomerase